MNDPLDRPIRDAVAAAAAAAPEPVPYDRLDEHPVGNAVARRRWGLSLAAGLIAVAGVAGVAVALASRSGGDVGSTPTGTGTAPAPETTTVATSTPAATTAVATSAPAATVSSSTPTSTPPSAPPTTASVPSAADAALFPAPGTEAGGASNGAPSGSIDAGPGDLVGVTADGDLWLYPGAFDPPQYGRTPGEPVRLVDLGDPREPVLEGEGPNGVDDVGGFVNGALVYSECCEPVAGTIAVVSEPDGPKALWTYGWAVEADPTGRRWANAGMGGVSLTWIDTGRTAGYWTDAAPDGSYQQFHDVAWSPDLTELWALATVYDDDRLDVVLVRLAIAPDGLTEVERRNLHTTNGVSTAMYGFAGRLPDGTVVMIERTDTAATAVLLGDGARALERPAPWELPADAGRVSVSPDGTTLAYMVGDTAFLQREGQAPVEWGRGLRGVWFVTTPRQPLGVAGCESDGPYWADWLFADLDGDGVSERVRSVERDGSRWLVVCGGSGLDVAPLELADDAPRLLSPIDVDADGRWELWVGAPGAPARGQCVALHHLVDGVLTPRTGSTCIGADVGFACVELDGVVEPVFYDRDGATLTARTTDGTVLGTHTYPSADAVPRSLFDLAC